MAEEKKLNIFTMYASDEDKAKIRQAGEKLEAQGYHLRAKNRPNEISLSMVIRTLVENELNKE